MKIISIVILGIICGCVARGPDFGEVTQRMTPVPDHMARIVFFRTRDSALYIARKARISLDGEKLAATPYGGFHYHDVPHGSHRLQADMWDAPGRCELVLEASSGHTYYFQVDPRGESFGAFAMAGFATEMVVGGVLSGLAAGLAGAVAESYEKECGGAFRLYPVDPSTAGSKLLSLKHVE